jgi:hypothetical protein
VKVCRLRSSNWAYVGYVLVAVGGSFALTGAVALFSMQQGALRSVHYSSSFLPILIAGICFAVIGISAFALGGKMGKQEFPPPPAPDELPPPPPSSSGCSGEVLSYSCADAVISKEE